VLAPVGESGSASVRANAGCFEHTVKRLKLYRHLLSLNDFASFLN